jgi:hypothetical protein
LLDVLNAGRSNQRPRRYNLHPGDAEHPTKGVKFIDALGEREDGAGAAE